MPFSNEEAFDMLAVYFECFQNAMVASRVYAQRFPARRRHDRRTFFTLAQRLRATGSIHRRIVPRARRKRTEENIVNVLAYVQIYPHIGVRRMSLELGLARSTVHNILKDYK